MNVGYIHKIEKNHFPIISYILKQKEDLYNLLIKHTS